MLNLFMYQRRDVSCSRPMDECFDHAPVCCGVGVLQMLNSCTKGMTCHVLVFDEYTTVEAVVYWLSTCFQIGGSEPVIFPADLVEPTRPGEEDMEEIPAMPGRPLDGEPLRLDGQMGDPTREGGRTGAQRRSHSMWAGPSPSGVLVAGLEGGLEGSSKMGHVSRESSLPSESRSSSPLPGAETLLRGGPSVATARRSKLSAQQRRTQSFIPEDIGSFVF